MSSSTSNSKKTWRRRISWGFVGFLLLFAASEAFVFRDVYFYGIEYRSAVGQFAELDLSFRNSSPEKISTAVLGDSQSIDALRPELLAGALGRDSGTIFNFSISGGKAYDIYHTYLEYEDRLVRLKEAIVVVNEHQINSTGMAADEKFRYYAGLKDRLKVLDWDNYGELLLGWVSKGFDLRTRWSAMLDSYFKGTLPKQIPQRTGGIHAQTQVEKDHLAPEWAEDTADRWFKEYDMDGLQTDSFDALLQRLEERGVRVIVLQIPRSPLFEETIKRKYPDLQQQYFETIGAVADRHGAEFHVMSNEGLTLKEHFRDINHLNPLGASIVSSRVANTWLK